MSVINPSYYKFSDGTELHELIKDLPVYLGLTCKYIGRAGLKWIKVFGIPIVKVSFEEDMIKALRSLKLHNDENYKIIINAIEYWMLNKKEFNEKVKLGIINEIRHMYMKNLPVKQS